MTQPAPRVETPLVPAWRNKELICLLDTSGSMEWEAADGSAITRHQIVAEALPAFVRALEGEDSAAEAEQASGSDEEGGLLIHGFSNLHAELGDFNTSNFARRWDAIQWGGGTTIMPAWKAALKDFNEEFGDETEPPVLLTLVITDGEATDAAEFGQVLKSSGPDRYFAIAVLGHGTDHDKTLASYQAIGNDNLKHVKVMSFDSVTDPQELARDLILMAGLGK